MRVTVKVIPNARQASFAKTGPHSFLMKCLLTPEKGKVNDWCREQLAHYYTIAPTRITLVRGQISRTKIFEIPTVNS